MPLGTDVDLGPDDIVLDGDPADPQRGTAPIFIPCLLAKQRDGSIPTGTNV